MPHFLGISSCQGTSLSREVAKTSCVEHATRCEVADASGPSRKTLRAASQTLENGRMCGACGECVSVAVCGAWIVGELPRGSVSLRRISALASIGGVLTLPATSTA